MDHTLIFNREFKTFNVNIYGTYEKPLFKAKEIGELLDIKNIRDTISNYNNKQRCDVGTTDNIGREQKTTFLTEQKDVKLYYEIV